MVKRVSTILCQITDMNRAVDFYREQLGLTPGVNSPWWTDFEVGDLKIGLHPPFEGGAKDVGRGWILGIEVDDVRTLRDRLVSAGVGCGAYHDIPGGCVIDFADPDGNPIQAMQAGVSSKDLA